MNYGSTSYVLELSLSPPLKLSLFLRCQIYILVIVTWCCILSWRYKHGPASLIVLLSVNINYSQHLVLCELKVTWLLLWITWHWLASADVSPPLEWRFDYSVAYYGVRDCLTTYVGPHLYLIAEFIAVCTVESWIRDCWTGYLNFSLPYTWLFAIVLRSYLVETCNWSVSTKF